MISQPQTVTIAQARASTATGLLVADTAANIVAAMPNAALSARVASFTVSTGASLSAAQMSLLFPIAGKLHAAAGSLALSGGNVFTAAQLAGYEALPGFTVAPSGSINLSDTTAQVVGVLAAHPAWFAQISGVTIHLDGTSIGAYPASQLNGLLSHGKSLVFVPSAGHTTLNIAAAAHDLATNTPSLNALGSHQTLSFTVLNDGTGISAIDAVSLTTLQGFSPAAHTLFVSDAGINVGAHLAALIGAGFAQIQVSSGTLSATAAQLLDPSVHFIAGAHALLAASATLNAAAAANLAALPGISSGTGAVLTIADSVANLVASASAWQGTAGAVVVNADAVVTAGIAAGLAQIATSFGSRFTLSGHSLTVSDTLANLIGQPTQAVSLATAFVLSTDATATAAQFSALQSLPHFGFGGHTVAVADSATNLLALAGADLSHVSSVSLLGSAVVSVAQMLTFAAEPNFSAGGHALVIADTAANLLTLPSSALHLATAVELSADATLSAAAAQVLTGETGYTSDPFLLTIADSATVLSNLAAPVVAFAASEQVSVSATITAATAAALANLPHLTEAPGVALTVQDTTSNLLSASAPALAVAAAVRLVPGSTLVTDVAHAVGLASIQAFSATGSTITVSDNLANLSAANTAAWSSVAAAHAIVDNAGALIGAVGSSLLTSASSVSLAAPATVTASAAAILASLPNFTSDAQLSVADTTAALIAHTPALVALGCPVAVMDSATVNAAGAADLAQIAAASGVGFSLGHQTLTIAGTAADLLGLTPGETALAGAVALTADATLTAAQFGALRNLPHVSSGGHVILLSDTAASLASLGGDFSMIAAASLNADASVTAGRFALLTALPNFSASGHTLAVTDTAANLLGIAMLDLSQTTSVVLSSNATVNGQQALVLTTEPGFLTGGHLLTIADTADNLLALPNSLLLSAYSLALSGDQTVSASVLSHLAALGIKFTTAGHFLTCTDTATDLASLSVAAATLAHAEVLGTSSVVNAATAAALANLPGFSLASGVSLTVQDSASNLLALGQAIPVCTTAETLVPGTTANINAQQATRLAALPHFAPSGASIIVTDTISALTAAGTAVLQAIATTVNVADTAANLGAGAASPIVQTAGLVSLSGNALVTASVAAEIASIPHFSSGNYQLEVVDTAANVAAQAAAVATVATATLVTDSGPINTAMADQLAAISASHVLSFQGGNQLLIQDSYAALTNVGNASGLALASRLGVVDTPTNLITASLHDWGALSPSFTLSQGGVITASAATSLAALGSHFSDNGYHMTVADTAGAVIGASAAINALHLAATVTDSAANLGAQASSLLALGTAVAHVIVSDVSPIGASVASTLSGLAQLLTGPTIQIADNAADIGTSLAGLTALGNHVAITVTDNAANVGQHASALATFGSHLSIVLTDSVPVTAAVASALAPVTTQLAPVALAVTDTGAAVAAHAATLANIGGVIGTVTLSDGNTQPAAIAAAMASLDGHLAPGVMLTATGSGAEITSNEGALAALNTDARLAAIIVANTMVSDVVNNLTALNALSAVVSVRDTAANVDAGLHALTQASNLQAIHLTDGGIPSFLLTIASLASSAATLTKVVDPYTVTVADTAANIKLDLVSGSASVIVGHLDHLGDIYTTDGQALTLSQAQLLASNIDDGPGSALSAFTGVVHAINVDIAHLIQVADLAHAPASIALTDTSADISNDLALGSSSAILDNLGLIVRIDLASEQPISLTAAQALSAGVDDGPNSALGVMSNAQLSVTAGTVADLPQLAGLFTVPVVIAISDTAANLSADLASTGSMLLANQATISSISVSDGMTISLTEQQLLAAGIDDGANSVLSKILGAQLAVDHVAAGDVTAVLALGVAPASISITDTAAHIVSNLSSVLTSIGSITAINVAGTALTLSAAEALESRADDGPGSLVDRITGHAFNIAGATISQLPLLASLPDLPALISVSDSSSNVAADLQSSQSLLVAAGSLLGTVNVTHGTLTLTDAEADTALASSSIETVLGNLAAGTVVKVIGVPINDIAAISSSTWSNVAVAVADTAANIASDLASPSSVLQANLPTEISVTITAGAVVSAATLAAMAALPHFQTAGFALTLHDDSTAVLSLSSTTLALAHTVEVVDTASIIEANLSALQSAFGGALSIILTDASPAITVTATEYMANQATIDAVTNPNVFTVSDSATALSGIAGALASDPAINTVTATDSAYNVIESLSALSVLGSKLHVTLSDTSIAANLVAPLLTVPNLSPAGLPVSDVGSQIAALVESGVPGVVAYLNTNGASLSTDSIVSANDAAALEGLNMFSKAGHTLVVWDTAQHLSQIAYLTALSSSVIDSVHLKTTTGTAIVTASQAAALFSIPGFSTHNPSGSSNAVVVSDSAAHIDAQLSTLLTNAGQVSSVVVNSSATITDQTLSDLQSLSATPLAGITLSVRDTASNIAASAASQSAGQSILPASWTLSASSTVSEGDAVMLGGLSNFSAGPYTLTLALNADTLISITDANKLGSLASALHLSSHQLLVAGSAAQLFALSSGALQIVTPKLADTASHLAALSSASPLLLGTVEVTGNDALNASTTTALLNLVRSGSGNGIAANELSFDNAHTVTDTIANLHLLTSSTGWIGNAALHAALPLTAQDTVGNLVDPANRAFLSTLTSTTPLGDTVIGVATANALSSCASAIHFDRGASHIEIQGSTADLINPNNANGIAIADTVQLSSPDHVDAADAESLLSISHFELNTILTIRDSSINLLDGALGSAVISSGFGSHIVVELAGPETLDAQTAASLVSIPGFSDVHNMTISDDSSYLLDTGNISAEQMATEVTLAGDETVSANTVLRLSHVPHFSPGDSHLVLSGNDFADVPTLKAIADLGGAFDPNGHTVSMTADALTLTSAEFAALQNDNISQNGHLLGVSPAGFVVTDFNNTIHMTGTGVSGGSIKVYAADGSLVSSTAESSSVFTVAADDIGPGHNFSITQLAGGITSESAPVVLLDAGSIESAVAAAGSNLASSGQIQVDAGKFIDLFQAGAVPSPLTHAALVYDPVAHTVALDIPGQGATTLITLGGSTHPSGLDASEILFKLHG